MNSQAFIATRWAQYAAEVRVNLCRVAGIAIFFSVHAIHYFAASRPDSWVSALGMGSGQAPDRRTHLAICCLALVWLVMAVVIHICLRGRYFPRWWMYATVALDVALLTTLLAITQGPASPLVAVYFLIVAMTGPRLDLRLTRAGTLFAAAGYVMLLGCVKWPGALTKLNQVPVVPRYHQAIVFCALLLMGVLVGQTIRMGSWVARVDRAP